jgi:hypothetical protein
LISHHYGISELHYDKSTSSGELKTTYEVSSVITSRSHLGNTRVVTRRAKLE